MLLVKKNEKQVSANRNYFIVQNGSCFKTYKALKGSNSHFIVLSVRRYRRETLKIRQKRRYFFFHIKKAVN